MFCQSNESGNCHELWQMELEIIRQYCLDKLKENNFIFILMNSSIIAEIFESV